MAEVMWVVITWRRRCSTTWRKRPSSKTNSAFHIMMNVFHDLCLYLKSGNLPHYFLPECNLLATVGEDERQIAIQTIRDIVCDPISTILKCPSAPMDIYGDICPDDLVLAFHNVSAHPCSERRHEHLVQFLSRLDQWRQWCYARLLDTDRSDIVTCMVSGRPALTALVDMLDAWKNENTWTISSHLSMCFYSVDHWWFTSPLNGT